MSLNLTIKSQPEKERHSYHVPQLAVAFHYTFFSITTIMSLYSTIYVNNKNKCKKT